MAGVFGGVASRIYRSWDWNLPRGSKKSIQVRQTASFGDPQLGICFATYSEEDTCGSGVTLLEVTLWGVVAVI